MEEMQPQRRIPVTSIIIIILLGLKLVLLMTR